jgi:hypothetical protein
MKTIVKGILLWVTVFSILLFLMGGCESLIENGNWIILLVWTLINVALGYACKKFLTYKDAYKVSGLQTFDSIVK